MPSRINTGYAWHLTGINDISISNAVGFHQGISVMKKFMEEFHTH